MTFSYEPKKNESVGVRFHFRCCFRLQGRDGSKRQEVPASLCPAMVTSVQTAPRLTSMLCKRQGQVNREPSCRLLFGARLSFLTSTIHFTYFFLFPADLTVRTLPQPCLSKQRLPSPTLAASCLSSLTR